jgi:hypothetical protein
MCRVGQSMRAFLMLLIFPPATPQASSLTAPLPLVPPLGLALALGLALTAPHTVAATVTVTATVRV